MTALPSPGWRCSPPCRTETTTTTSCTRLEELVAAHPLGILTDPVHDLTRWAKGLRAAGSGDSVGALHHLGRFRLPVLARMAAPERIEAAVRAGRPAAARGWTEELARLRRRHPKAVGARHGRLRARADGRPERCRGARSRSRWPTTSGPVARSTRRAPSWPTGSGCAAANAASTPASTCATPSRPSRTCAPKPWPHGPTRSCAPPGETARKRDPSTLVKLTPTELQIAQLVSSGLSNKEVAAQCWISPQDRRLPPAQRLRQGRRHLPRRAGPARPGLARPHRAHPGHLTGVSNRHRLHARSQCHHHLTARARPP